MPMKVSSHTENDCVTLKATCSDFNGLVLYARLKYSKQGE